MQQRMTPPDPDEPVFVIDLRAPAMREVEREIEIASAGAFVPRVLPAQPEREVRWVALLVEGRSDPLLLPIEATDDLRRLDALARLVRFGVVRGMSVREVTRQYGSAYERALVDRGELPGWALGDLEVPVAETLPDDVRRALS